jgi:lipopolysaccharide/colanic/teichoic acid biosynthesis glycosyltransferase
MIKRLFDIVFSLMALIILIPVFLVIAFLILLDSKGGIFYFQKRVGKDEKEFNLFKFRTMKPQSDQLGLLTVGGRDARITKIGFNLRKYKLDELPQLFNVLLGDMSLVGPRPEVKKYTDLYNDEQKKVLSVKPGITDYASIIYFEENELLAKSSHPETTYINEVMPAKLKLNLRYIKDKSLVQDFKIIIRTLKRILA